MGIRTVALFKPSLNGVHLTVDALGTAFVTFLHCDDEHNHAVYRSAGPQEPFRGVALDFLLDKSDLQQIAVHPDGRSLFVRTHQQGIWRANLDHEGMVQHAEQLVSMEESGLQFIMQCAGDALYYFKDRGTLKRVDLRTGALSTAANPSMGAWVVVESNTGSLQLYYPRSQGAADVMRVDLKSGQQTELVIPGASVSWMLQCGTGDGKLVITPDRSRLCLWDPCVSAEPVLLAVSFSNDPDDPAHGSWLDVGCCIREFSSARMDLRPDLGA